MKRTSFNLERTSLNHIPKLLRSVKWRKGTLNLDLGGGKYDKATNYLRECGVENIVVDPYARDEEHNLKAFSRFLKRDADTATLSNVLCVVKEEKKRLEALSIARDLLKPNGKIYISIFAGDGSGVGRRSKSNTWQNNRPLRTYLKEIQKVFPTAELAKGYIHARKDEDM